MNGSSRFTLTYASAMIREIGGGAGQKGAEETSKRSFLNAFRVDRLELGLTDLATICLKQQLNPALKELRVAAETESIEMAVSVIQLQAHVR